MYPNIGQGNPQPSAPPQPPSSSNPSALGNTGGSQPVGFSSLMAQPTSQQPPYPSGPQASLPPYNNPYGSNNQPPKQGNFSSYSLPQVGQQPPPQQGGGGYQQGPYPPQSNPYSNSNQPSGFSGNNQPPPNNSGYQNPYGPSNSYPPQQGFPNNQNPYRPSNPYPPQQGNSNYQNPYGPQQGGYPPPQQPPPQYQSPYSANPQQNQGPGYNANSYGGPGQMNERLRAIAGRYEISDQLAQRLNILQQFEIVVLCDDSGSMNTPVDGTNGTRWDELRSIVQIVIEIGTVFDSNGVDVHFLNRRPMPNVTDTRQVMESFSERPSGLTPLTSALRRIFQSAASKPGSDKRLLVFVATDGAPTDANGNVDIQSLENLMRNERQANTTYVTFLACTDDESSVSYLSQWDRNMMNVDVVDDYKSEREEIRRTRGPNFPFSFGDYVAKALLGSVDPQMDQLDEWGNNNNNNYRRF
ncbi:unnamed protein product [Adineta ricciae]|uniref:VWFA domain-containing protein n=1 Tax=Adineta ricciae TaxID=249248 RepID=A0A814RLQ1_ADIRI|nr:unnamed protein product [Adineta ricciae]CAF1337489.1 unnamed protein product [Adineta ricciae]